MKKILVSGIVATTIAITSFASFAIANENKETPNFNPHASISSEQHEILKDKIKTDLDEMLSAGEITQEQYNSLVERMEKGAPHNMDGGGFGRGNFGKGQAYFRPGQGKANGKAKGAKKINS